MIKTILFIILKKYKYENSIKNIRDLYNEKTKNKKGII